MSASVDGVRTVARQEFRLRIRAGRWKWLLAIWFVVLLGFTALLRQSLSRQLVFDEGGGVGRPREDIGVAMYGGLMLFVLALALLVVPALAAQSINGDRERGTLATVQVTRLSATELALGKFVAAWGAALLFLALALPLVAWCIAEGGVTAGQVLATTGVMSLLLGTVVAVALALSALLARTSTSGVLSYVAVFTLTIGTLIAFTGATYATTENQTVTQQFEVPTDVGEGYSYNYSVDDQGRLIGPDGQPIPSRTETSTYTEAITRTDRSWVLLAPNPFVVLADAAPVAEPQVRRDSSGEIVEVSQPLDPLGELGRGVRDLRLPPSPSQYSDSGVAGPGIPPAGLGEPVGAEPRRGGPVWPTGLAVNLLLAVLALVVTARRLRTPSRKLPRGQRVA